eukprot:c26374_g1_i1 orf=214-1767(-)
MDPTNLAVQWSSVLLDINHGDRLTFARLSPSASIKIGNVKCSLAPLVGSPYGAVFELRRGPHGPSLFRISSCRRGGEAETSQMETNSVEGKTDSNQMDGVPGECHNVAGEYVAKDNRDLLDDNTAQKLTVEDIDQLRREGASGNEIVEALIANSTTFQSKTLFSQEKYKRKKQKKYAPQLVLRRPCARSVCEAYFLKAPNKIGFLRIDMLALMLSLANVGAHAEVLVMDMVGGLLIAAVAERIGGFGSVCSIYDTLKPPPMDILGLFNFSDSTANKVLRASLSEIIAVQKLTAENIEPAHATVTISGVDCAEEQGNDLLLCREACRDAVSDQSKKNQMNEIELDLPCQSCSSLEPELAETLGAVSMEGSQELSHELASGTIEYSILKAEDELLMSNGKRCAVGTDTRSFKRINRAGRHATADDMLHWVKHGFTSLIVGAPGVDPWSAAQQLLPFLCPSCPFVIYHPYLQPIANCMHQLQVRRMAVALQISEPWLREYQCASYIMQRKWVCESLMLHY